MAEKKFNKKELLAFLNYKKTNEDDDQYVYYTNPDSNKLDNLAISSVAFAQSNYLDDTRDAAEELSKRDIDKDTLSSFIKFTTNEMSGLGFQASVAASTIRDLNLDGSYPNDNDLEHRVRNIIKQELSSNKSVSSKKK